MNLKQFTTTSLLAVAAIVVTGCQTPDGRISGSPIVVPTEVVDHNPFGSAEVKACAKHIAPQMLMVPELNSGYLTRIIVEPLKNNSSVRVNSQLFVNVFKAELANIARAQGIQTVRFISNNQRTIATGNAVVREKMEAQVSRVLDELATDILAAPVVASAKKPPVIAITPAINTNLVNLNANSFIAMLRAKIARKAAGKVLFTAPGSLANADYYLTGEFIAESMKNEGMVNLVDYINLMEKRLKEGKPMANIFSAPTAQSTTQDTVNATTTTTLTFEKEQSLLNEISRRSSLRVPPNTNKHLNVMLIKADTKISHYENMFTLDKKDTTGKANVDFILSGEISGTSRRVNGTEENYIVVTLFLNNPETKEEIWTGTFETKKITRTGVVY